MTDRPAGGNSSSVGAPAQISSRRSPRVRHLRAVPDRPSLDDIYRDQVDFVVRMARHLRVEPAHVEDVVHDVFLVVHRRLSDYDPQASLRSWLYGITLRVVMHHRRRQGRTRRREQQHAPVPPTPIDPERDVAERQAARIVEACLAQLPEDQRTVFMLADVEQMAAPEIAALLQLKLNTVYSRLRLARRRLDAMLARHGGGES